MIGSGLASRPDDPLLVLVDVADLGSASGSGPALLRNRRRYRFLRQAGHGASVLRLFCGLGHDGTIHALPKAGAIASHVRVPRDPALPLLLDPFGSSPNLIRCIEQEEHPWRLWICPECFHHLEPSLPQPCGPITISP